MTENFLSTEYIEFLENLKDNVKSSRLKAVRAVNSELILLYHKIGTEILKKQNSLGWGSKVIDRLSKDLIATFPDMKGFSPRNLKYMRLFSDNYQDVIFVQQLAAQLPWFHIVTILERLKTPEERAFYIKNSLEHSWSRSVLTNQIDTNLFSRQGKAISNFKDKLPSHQYELTQQTLKDPYVFDFLSIGNEAYERELETSLIRHMEKFLIELGSGFAFVGRQYHVEIGGDDFYIDLLMYHLKLRSFIVIELKTDKFKPEYAGKINFYLSAIDELLKHPSDNPSIGLILCKTKNQVQAEYALRDLSKPIGLAEYRLNEALPEDIKTNLPTIEELEHELKQE
ncbi:PDDEXK nuclease domain-containing protein [Spirobacillus cienkowskii]|uniref:PDDEXK nuclease domain-containing protein n=1 Tax=Spirobacillus cienkowskii TaxID=495820 RepID=UPI0030D5716C